MKVVGKSGRFPFSLFPFPFLYDHQSLLFHFPRTPSLATYIISRCCKLKLSNIQIKAHGNHYLLYAVKSKATWLESERMIAQHVIGNSASYNTIYMNKRVRAPRPQQPYVMQSSFVYHSSCCCAAHNTHTHTHLFLCFFTHLKVEGRRGVGAFFF